MTNNLDTYYINQKEPFQSCLIALRDIILNVNVEIVPICRFQIPFFAYKELNLAFLWVYRKKVMMGFVTDRHTFRPIPGIRFKDQMETFLLDPNEDIPIEITNKKLQNQILNYDVFLRNKTI